MKPNGDNGKPRSRGERLWLAPGKKRQHSLHESYLPEIALFSRARIAAECVNKNVESAGYDHD
jgi:hypothetical protein